MRMAILIVVSLAVIVALALEATHRGLVLDRLLAVGPVTPVNFPELKLGDRPNQYLVCPENFCASPPHRVSPVFDIPLVDLAVRLQGLTVKEPGLSMLGSDAATGQTDFLQRTPLLRFPDLITVRLIALDSGRSTLALYSRSIYGHSDLGANQARIDHWITALQQAR